MFGIFLEWACEKWKISSARVSNKWWLRVTVWVDDSRKVLEMLKLARAIIIVLLLSLKDEEKRRITNAAVIYYEPWQRLAGIVFTLSLFVFHQAKMWSWRYLLVTGTTDFGRFFMSLYVCVCVCFTSWNSLSGVREDLKWTWWVESCFLFFSFM